MSVNLRCGLLEPKEIFSSCKQMLHFADGKKKLRPKDGADLPEDTEQLERSRVKTT